MRFHQFDLNLLVYLDALLTEQSFSKAAARVFLSQSAMSEALARLREFFSDDLLVQVDHLRRLVPELPGWRRFRRGACERSLFCSFPRSS